MTSPFEPFSRSYAEARRKFLDAAGAAGLAATEHRHPLPGRGGETLALDVVVDGDPDATDLLIVSSGCHGVEGYCGSGVQVAALRDPAWRAAAAARGVAVVYLHALNPFGFSHLRRVTDENVDLNRNFHDFGKPLPVNAEYRTVHPLLMPQSWPPSPEHLAEVERVIAARSFPVFQAIVSRGQHEFPDGLFFGGTEPTWSNRTLRTVLRAVAGRAHRIAWIDLHTGLGPTGVGERIHAGPDDAAMLARSRAWWGPHVTSIYDGSSVSALLTGLMFQSVLEECPQAEYTGIAIEYGTQPIEAMFGALTAENWLNNHPEAPEPLAAAIKQQMLEAFYVDTDVWRGAVLMQAREAMQQAIDGLSGRTGLGATG
ncbi:MAG: M14 family metallopeptidase [Lautropia sp.]